MFCIISTSVGGMITAAWWLSLSNSDPMIPKIINYLNHESTTNPNREILLPQPILPFWRMFCGTMLWSEQLNGETIERPKWTRRIRRKTMATPTTTTTTTTTTRRTIALNLMLLQDCMHVSRSSQQFLPDPPPGPPVGPPFFWSVYFTNKQTIGRVFCPVQFLWISSSAIIADGKIPAFFARP